MRGLLRSLERESDRDFRPHGHGLPVDQRWPELPLSHGLEGRTIKQGYRFCDARLDHLAVLADEYRHGHDAIHSRLASSVWINGWDLDDGHRHQRWIALLFVQWERFVRSLRTTPCGEDRCDVRRACRSRGATRNRGDTDGSCPSPELRNSQTQPLSSSKGAPIRWDTGAFAGMTARTGQAVLVAPHPF